MKNPDTSYIPIIPFKNNCNRYKIQYKIKVEKDGTKHIVLTSKLSDMKTVLCCLSLVLEKNPALEAALIQEVERKEANLRGR